MKTTISRKEIDKLHTRLMHLRFGCGIIMLAHMTVDTPTTKIRSILGKHDETGRLSAQVKQALLQGAI